ncbi:hypothetical protein phiK7A1_003c [Pseudomonas phage phiK7A1]|uniref:Uncharacterized protein n=1 Tax=Pseudomonas phage phiK7A1 TaxID=2759194 RepID=A0A7H0XFK3_9CAUD|nr:hypothetical protein phiK7A1_003c [Pseudomonas phage phiK7A1]
METLDKYASRKFWLAVVFQIVFVVMLWHGKMPISAFENLTYMLLGGYFISNVTQKIFVKETA